MSILDETFFLDLGNSYYFIIPDPHLGSDNLRDQNNLVDNAIIQERGGIPVAVRKQSTALLYKIKYDVLSKTEVENFRFFYREKIFEVFPQGSTMGGLAFTAVWQGGFFPKMLRAGVYTLEFTIREVI